MKLLHAKEGEILGIEERQSDILRIVDDLDISPTLYKNAVEKYQHLTSYLE